MKIGERTLEIMNKATWYNSWLLMHISKYLRGEILEVGAGSGNFSLKLSKYGRVTAIDKNPAYKNADYGDVEKGKYFFGKKYFDVIVCMNVLEHIKNDNEALNNMYTLLRPGGKLILLVPAFGFAYGQIDKGLGHYRRYTKKKVENKLRDSKFKIQNSCYLNWLGLIGWFINGRILKRKILPENQLGIFNVIARPFLTIEKFIRPVFGLSVLVIGEKK